MMKPSIAILTQNSLMGLGLRNLLGELLPQAELNLYHTFEEFDEAQPPLCVHFFVDMPLFLLHRSFFEEQRHKTILLVGGAGGSFSQMHQIDITASEEQLVQQILKLRQGAHRPEHQFATQHCQPQMLSPREGEVLTLLARGYMNKEIAEMLHIGLTTVITHRRNIMEKLGIKTIAGLTLYAASMGYVAVDSI